MIRSLGFALVLALGMAVAVSGENEELTGVITQVTGTVELSGQGVPRVPVAVPWQVVRNGVILNVPEGGAAGVVCSNLRFVRIQGDTIWRLTEQACAKGILLTLSEYALVVPRGGRFRSVRGLLVLEREMRGEEGGDPLAPVILSPRNTAIRSSRPSILWMRVPSAIEYQVEWSGRGADAFVLRLDARDVPCKESWNSTEVCELPWPTERSDLLPGRTSFLQVAARSRIVEPWHKVVEAVEVRTLGAEESALVEKHLHELEELGLTGTTLETARGGILAGAGLYAEATEAYLRVNQLAPVASLRVTLADVYLLTGLHNLALRLYVDALEDAEPEVRAAAAFGAGRIEYARARYHEATLRFRQAQEIYRTRGLGEEEAAARNGLKQAEARISQ